MRLYRPIVAAVAAITFLGGAGAALAEEISILNVSYDPTRELYDAYNKWFSQYWEEKTGNELNIRMSHAGSATQARAIIDGVPADVASLAVAIDITAIAEKTDLIDPDWQSELPHDSSPYTSVAVLLVREGNPKNINGWEDLARENVSVITPNPKTSGGARWNFLAMWAWAEDHYDSKEAVRDYINAVYENVPVLKSGTRGATVTFVKRNIGDVDITYENEALLALHKFGKDKFDIVVPDQTILIQMPVTVVDKNAKRHGTTKVAKAYLKGLYTDKGQRLIAKHFYRPVDDQIRAEFSELYADTDTFTVAERFGSWEHAQEKFFSEGGVFDQIYLSGPEG